MTQAKVIAVNISEQKGQIKHSVPYVELRADYGIVGDAHANQGSIRQISLLGVESMEKMRAIGAEGLCCGKFAENITTEGIILHKLPVGTRLQIGDTLHEVTQIGKKCHAADGCEIARTVGSCIMPTEGIFTKILIGGTLRPNDPIAVLD